MRSRIKDKVISDLARNFVAIFSRRYGEKMEITSGARVRRLNQRKLFRRAPVEHGL